MRYNGHMLVLFEVVKGLFFFLSCIAFLVVARGELLFGKSVAGTMTMIVIPGYLVMCGIMVAYIVVKIWGLNHDEEMQGSLMIKIFVGGLLLGSLMAVAYVLV